MEHDTMIQSRQIAAEMGLDMKIGDVEYQGDKIKAIFYYIAEVRVDFRELIKVFAERFHIRIEMKQIGARQEAGRIGGIGACGRELCCASWIPSFSSVTTNAARVQDISLNPQKLAGQCSKLKCCLMYEYDVYADARQTLPRLREPLQAMDGEYYLVKTDILARTMSFSSSKESMSNVVTIPTSRVREILAMNRAGKKVDSIVDKDSVVMVEEPTFRTEEDSITRFDNQNKRRRKNKSRDKSQRERQPKGEAQQAQQPQQAAPETTEKAPKSEGREKEQRHDKHHKEHRYDHRNKDHRHDNRDKEQPREAHNKEPRHEGQEQTHDKSQEKGQPRERNNRRNFRPRKDNRHGNAGNENGGNAGNAESKPSAPKQTQNE